MSLAGSPMTRAHITALLERGVRKVYFEQHDKRGNQYEKLFNVSGSQKATETDVNFAGLSEFSLQAEGSTWNYDNGQVAWTKTYINLEYSKGVQVTRIAMADDLYGTLKKLTSIGGNMGKAAAYTKEVLAMNLFNSLSATVYTADTTNYTLLSTTHFRVDGGTRSNRPTAAVDLSDASLEAALSDWRVNMVDQRGMKIMVEPEWLVVGPADEFLAERLLVSTLRPGGNDNDINAIRTRRNLKVFVSDFLTNDGRWFLVAPKDETQMNWFNREATQMERFDTPENGNMNLIGHFRASSGATDILGIYGSP